MGGKTIQPRSKPWGGRRKVASAPRLKRRISCKRKPAAAGEAASTGAVAAGELRAALPRLWRQFRQARAGSRIDVTEGSGSAMVRFSLEELRAAMKALRGPCCRWASSSEADLRQLLSETSQLQPLRRRLGYRFQDPSKHGSWSMTNLVGFAFAPADARRGGCKVSWDNYTVTFEMAISLGGVFEIKKSMGRQVVACCMEKRRRGDSESPLAEERYTVTAHSRCQQAGDRRKRIKVATRPLDLLPAVILRPPSGPQRWTLIYLHGLGSSALGNYADHPHFFLDGSNALKVVVPTAPSRELSCFDTWWEQGPSKGWYLKKFLSWYDYLSNHDGRKEDTIDLQSLLTMRRALHQLVKKEAAELGGRTDRVILGGKSQGCCTSLDAALSYPRPLGGFIGIVGHLLSCTPVEPDSAQLTTPLHFFHEPQDDIMQWPWVQRAERRLRDVGFCVRSSRRPDPENCGHFIQGVEGTWVRAALRSICASADV